MPRRDEDRDEGVREPAGAGVHARRGVGRSCPLPGESRCTLVPVGRLARILLGLTAALGLSACLQPNPEFGVTITDGSSGGSETASTTASPGCGDGVVAAGEECDDGNADNTDACLSTCVLARCGDGVVQAGVE
ncbi:MAG: DUF4215 domain-containing protein, partial [Myxococcales bacterium]|nr:DUF4215 domain-containing protein [Myxococcales bacterium]